MNLPQNNYLNILNSLKEKIRQSRFRAVSSVNLELLKLYWEIGKTIIEQQKTEGWGTKVTNRLAKDLRTEFPDFKGLSERNLVYMQTFASSYPYFAFTQATLAELPENTKNIFTQVSPAELQSSDKQKYLLIQGALAQLTWYHHTTLLDKVKDAEARIFYVLKTVENGWSRNIMVRQIESELHKRTGTAITNFKHTLPQLQSDLAQQTLKNPYVFDFLGFGEAIKERELERGLIQHLKKFLLELGKGFAYVGNQKNIVVEDDDYFLDLLFYNYNMHCFVVFELKVGDFKPEFAGKLNFYVNTVNEQYKGENDKRTIGVLLCKTPNETVVRYSLKGIESPIGVADYKLENTLPKQIKSEIPTIEELEAELGKEYEELKSPSQKRLEALKEKLSQLKSPEVKQKVTTEILFEIIDKSLLPLYRAILKRMEEYTDLFVSCTYNWHGKNDAFKNIEQFAKEWKEEGFLKNNREFHFNCWFEGLKSAGTNTFGISLQLNFVKEMYWYGFTLINYNNSQPFIKKLYHEQLTSVEIESIVDIIFESVMENIEQGIERIKPDNK